MDVPDRLARLDVLSVAAPAASVTSTAPAASDGPSFADSLQRAPQHKPSAEAEPAPPPAAEKVTAGNFHSTAPGPAGSENSPPASDQTIAGDETAQDAGEVRDDLAELIAAALISAANPPQPPTAPEKSAVATPPASLLNALQSTPLNPVVTVAPPAALPSIPSGLQAGLIPSAAGIPGAESPTVPVPAGTNPTAAATDSARLSPMIVAELPPGVTTNPGESSPLASEAASSVKIAQATGNNPNVEPERKSSAPEIGVPSVAPASNSLDTKPPAESVSPGPVAAEAAGLLSAATAVPPASDQKNFRERSSARPAARPISPDMASVADPSLLAGWNAATQDGSSFAAQLGGLQAAAPTADSSAAPGPSVLAQLEPALHQAVTGERELTMTLRPPELGAVRIEVRTQDGVMSARLHTETSATQQLLTEHLPQLREMLSQLGVSGDQVLVQRVDSVSDNSSGTGARTDAGADSRDSNGRPDARQQPPSDPQLADEPDRDAAERPGIRTRTALNLRI